MSDQNGGKTETSKVDSSPETAPDSKPEANFPQNRVPPVIEGEAEDLTPPPEAAPSAEHVSSAGPEAEPEAEPGLKSEEQAEEPTEAAPESRPEPKAEQPERTGGAFRPVAVLLGAVALGGGAYYLWDAYVAEPPSAPPKIAETAPAPVKPAPPPLAGKTITPPASPETPNKAESPAPPKPQTESAPAASKSAATPAAETARPAVNAETDKAVIEMTARLAAAQSAVERLTQRLQAVESQLAAPKNDARATVSARDAGPNNSGEAAARLVVAQSLLTALRQGDDYATQLAALQNFGVDPSRIARLRAGVSAPSVKRLASDFTALAPQLAAAAAPPKPAEETKPPGTTGETILAYVKAQAGRLVRVRPAGAPDKDVTALQIEKIEQDLSAGDLVAALADREKLPAPALALSDAWATAARTRLEAEAAAKAELAEALQNLTKTKS